MKRFLLVFLLLILPLTAFAKEDKALAALFPTLAELPGGKDHWMGTIAPVEEANGCTVYSATYAYFAKEAKPLYDIPRKNVYSVNIRFHSCVGIEAASKLYDKFSKVGEKERKKLMTVGEKGVLYVIPSPLTELMGDYYLTSLFKYIVLQVHADDGFVLMDMSDMMAKRLEQYLNIGKKEIAAGITLRISKLGYDNSTELVTFTAKDIRKIDLTGVLYDENNRRVPEATVTVLETGNSTVTNDKGEFTLKLNSGKGKQLSLFRTLTLVKNSADKELPLAGGYYMVDIAYPEDRVGQDIWRVTVTPDGKIAGASMNLRDEQLLAFTGVLDGDNLTIDRPCGRSVLGTCRQHFTAQKQNGIYAGNWTGSMGSGEWKLYTSSFGKKTISVTPEEADLNIISGSKDGLHGISSGKEAKYITIKPSVKKHDDFLFISARLMSEVSSKGKANKLLYLYGMNGKKREPVASSHTLPISDKPAQGSVDITNMYRDALYPEYILGFSATDMDNFSASLKPSVELTFADPLSKAAVPGAVTAKLLTFHGEDTAGNTKIIRPGGTGDVVIEMEISSFGSALQGVEIVAKGKEGRRWNTYINNFYPGVAIISAGVLNAEDGSVNYPLQKFIEKLTLYADRGSLDPNDIDSIELTLRVNERNVTVPVMTEH